MPIVLIFNYLKMEFGISIEMTQNHFYRLLLSSMDKFEFTLTILLLLLTIVELLFDLDTTDFLIISSLKLCAFFFLFSILDNDLWFIIFETTILEFLIFTNFFFFVSSECFKIRLTVKWYIILKLVGQFRVNCYFVLRMDTSTFKQLVFSN